jgi:hypothetical protein
MAVVGVLAQAGIGDRHDRELERMDPAEGLLHDPVVCRSIDPERVLGLRQTEEEHPADAEVRQACRLVGRDVGRHAEDAGHRVDRLANVGARLDEQWRDQHRGMQMCLAHQRAEGRGASQATRTDGTCCRRRQTSDRWCIEFKHHEISCGWRVNALAAVAASAAAS